MSRLLSLYKSLSDEELNKLRNEIVKSEGVSYLNSKDESFLLNLACAERIEDLDHCAITVTRLGKKCSDPALCNFKDVYSDLKFGILNISKLDFVSKEVDKNIEKMEKLISATSNLYLEYHSLSEMEVAERKLKQWNQNTAMENSNSEVFDQKLAAQRQVVGHFQELSLWSQTFNKAVGLMARIICFVYARICVFFGPYVSVLPPVSTRNVRSRSGPLQNQTLQNNPIPDKPRTKSGPLGKPPKRNLIRFLSRDSNPIEDAPIGVGFGFGFGIGFQENHYYVFGDGKKNKLVQVAPPSTLGGSGLSLRYANVIIQVERYLNSPCSIGDDERENLYQMLPTSLKMSVRSKLRNRWKRRKGEGGESESWEDKSLAEGWREALKGIMGWLAPMAHDTVRWQAERNFERQNFEAKPTVLLLQTFHFSDREKTEAAIAEILVGVSCIFRYENRYFGSSSGSDDDFR
ncbi:protein PSK SIMULATOR 3-like [Telopea speciosissima]|uniref:protein PSK SIMULATOR 3-like n=1 Tax=Telopea speciosissima TaxID=54955 RepID=UPI001CC5AFB8|nr:protein PSK SIMULATOR 3-like [Telopea speciosissima]